MSVLADTPWLQRTLVAFGKIITHSAPEGFLALTDDMRDAVLFPSSDRSGVPLTLVGDARVCEAVLSSTDVLRDRRSDTFDYASAWLDEHVPMHVFDPDALTGQINRIVDPVPVSGKVMANHEMFEHASPALVCPAEASLVLYAYLTLASDADAYVASVMAKSTRTLSRTEMDEMDPLVYEGDPFLRERADYPDEDALDTIARMGGMYEAREATLNEPSWGNTTLPWHVLSKIIEQAAIAKFTGGYDISRANLCMTCRTYRATLGGCFCD